MSIEGSPLVFEHRIIDPHPTGTKNDVCLVGDITGSGLPDIVIGSKYGEDNLVWYENPSWRRHVIGTTHLEAGGVLIDITGNGKFDLVAGNPMDKPPGFTNNELYWWECPEDPREEPWPAYTITGDFRKYHDQDVGDVDGDGRPEIVFASQGAGVLAYYDIPADPRQSPWPRECLHVICDDRSLEGTKVCDIDGDGRCEVIAGTFIYKFDDDGNWLCTPLPMELDPRTLTAVGDLTGDGRPDIVLSEGELDSGRIVWFEAPDWKPHVLAEGFFHPHSLEVADFDGSGRLDVFVGEMGLKGFATPREVVFRNQGGGRFTPVVVGHLPTHAARIVDLNGNGLPDIVGKPYDAGRDQVDLLLNRTGAL